MGFLTKRTFRGKLVKNEFLLLNSSAASCYMNSGSEVCFPAEAPPSCDLTCYNKTMEVIEIYESYSVLFVIITRRELNNKCSFK